MKWIKDQTGRFPERPYYDLAELDNLIEGLICDFLRERHRAVAFPVSTNDLTVLIESYASDLDQYADLTAEEGDVEGVTLFFRDRKPEVKISQDLAVVEYREHRLRTTLAHEFAHVKLHNKLWQFDQLTLFPQEGEEPGPRCRRDRILRAAPTDWMEWQAGYVSGALLMPVTSLKELAHASFADWGVFGSVVTESANGAELIRLAANQFYVSRDAARVRLSQLGLLADGEESSRPMLR